MKKKILYLVAPILLITACTTSFGVGTGIGLGGGRSSVSVGTGVSTETKVKKDDKKVTDNKTVFHSCESVQKNLLLKR